MDVLWLDAQTIKPELEVRQKFCQVLDLTTAPTRVQKPEDSNDA